MTNKDVQLSKSLSWLLRHGAIKEGFELSSEGYLGVDQILQHKIFKGKYNRADIERVVASNDKQRFKLRTNPHTNVLEVKANQGHTVRVDDSDLTPILQPKYNIIVHGTYLKCWPQIKTEGLSRMQRQHIHLAKGTLDDRTVISGLRHNVQVYIYIDLKKALDDGIKFYESENGVILTEGNEKGYLEPKYFLRVVKVSTGFPSYAQQQDISRVFSPFGTATIDKMTNKFAYLSFGTEEEARAALQAKKVNLYGEFLTVKPYNVKQAAELRQPQTPKRDFTRSKQKAIVIAEPEQIDLSGDFHQQLDSVLGAVRLTQEEATTISALYADLERVLQALWPGCIAMPFGSITTGLGIKTSDADCYVHIPPQFQNANANFVNKAKRVLQSYPQLFAEILSIPRANTPIVKFFHIPTETNCDLSFKTPLGAQNSKLIAFLLHCDPRLIPMAVVIKYWAKIHGLSGTGKLTNYALTMLIIFYLQQPPISILPSVEWLQRDRANDVIVDYWNTGFMDNRALLPPSTNTSSISELLGGFFEYYATFNFDEMVVCPFLGSPIKKEAFRDIMNLPNAFELYKYNVLNSLAMPMRFTTSMCVQDPFEQCHNVSSPITSRLAVEIKAFFKFAANVYEKEKLNECEEFLKIILLQQPKIVRLKSHPEYRVTLFPRFISNIMDPDWKSVVREIVLTIFEKMLMFKLEKVDEKVNPETKKEKEKYTSTLTKPIWRRKQYIKLYGLMKDFQQRQTKITEEIINFDKQEFLVEFQLLITYAHDPKSAVVLIKLTNGDIEAFKDFGKFFMSILQNWFMTILKPYTKSPRNVNTAQIAETIKLLDSNLDGDDDLDSDDDEVIANAKSDNDKDNVLNETGIKDLDSDDEIKASAENDVIKCDSNKDKVSSNVETVNEQR